MNLEQRLKEYLVAGEGQAYVEAAGVQELLRRVRSRLVRRVPADEGRSESRRELEAEAARLLDEESRTAFTHLMLSAEERAECLRRLIQSMFGLGPLEAIHDQPDVTEIMVNGPSQVFVERGNRIERALDGKGRPIRFVDEQELRYVIDKIVAPVNKKVDESDPIVDARLPDGSRVSVVLYPVALSGTTVTIRRFGAETYSLAQLASLGSLPMAVADLLGKLVAARYNLVISGGTGSGKTTFLNALSMCIPSGQRVVTVEDAAELRLAATENLVQLESRPPNVEGKGEISIRQLVRAALRMRPDRIIVGEVRGPEALDMLQAMNTGHDGSLTTVHANSAQDVISRLETMVMMAGLDMPLSAVRQQIAGAVDLVIHLGRLSHGERVVAQVAQVVPGDGGASLVEDLFTLDEAGGTGNLRHTGLMLRRVQKLLRSPIKRDGLLGQILPSALGER